METRRLWWSRRLLAVLYLAYRKSMAVHLTPEMPGPDTADDPILDSSFSPAIPGRV